MKCFKWVIMFILLGQVSCSLMSHREIASSNEGESGNLYCHSKIEVPRYNLRCVKSLAENYNFSLQLVSEHPKNETSEGEVLFVICTQDERHASRVYTAAINCDHYNKKEDINYELPEFLVKNITGGLRGETKVLDCPLGFESNGINCRPVDE